MTVSELIEELQALDIRKGVCKMTFDEWYEMYRPIVNTLTDRDDDKFEMDGVESDDKFETYGIELGFVLGVNQFNPHNVWTLIDGEEGMYIVNGYHLCDRFAYFITDVPFSGEFLEVLYFGYNEVDEE